MGGGRTTTNKVRLPNQITNGLLGPGGMKAASGPVSSLFDPNGRQQALNSFLLDPNSLSQMSSVLGETMNGGKLNVMSDPAVQNMIKAMTAQSNTNLGQGLAQVRSRAALSGHTSTGGSSDLQNAQNEAVVRNQQNLDATLSPQLLNLYNQERSRQLGSVGAYGELQQFPLQTATQIANLYKGNATQAPQANPWLAMLAK